MMRAISFRQTGTVLRLALADLWFEKILALCSVLGLAAVLAPLVVLAGLRAGVVEGLREALLQDPRAREVVTVANRTLDASLLRQLAARADVAFLAPRTRALAATLLVEREDNPGGGARVELLISGIGDPLLARPPQANHQIVLSAAAAAALRVAPGERVVGRLARLASGQRVAAPLVFTVQDIAPPRSFERRGAFVTLPLAVAVEDFLDGVAVAPTDLANLPNPDRASYAGFRLYARQLEQVPALDADLQRQGLDIMSGAGNVANLLRVDDSLRILFGVVAGLGGVGFLISLGAGLWANVERKRSELALLRFLGLGTMALRLFPMTQAVLIAVLGSLVGVGVAHGAALVVNDGLAGTLALDRPLCVISSLLVTQAAGITLVGAVLVAAVAGTRAAAVEAWEGVTAV